MYTLEIIVHWGKVQLESSHKAVGTVLGTW